MTAPCEVRAHKARHLALAFLGAALALILTACGPAKTQQNEASSAPGEASSSAPPVVDPIGEDDAIDPDTDQVSDEDWRNTEPPTGTLESQLVDIGSVTLSAAPDANNGRRISVDLVFVYAAALMPVVESKTSSTWFGAKNKLMRDSQNDLRVMSWQVAPGEDVPETPVDFPPGATAVYLFADYAGRSAPALRITGAGTLAVMLESGAATIDIVQ